MENQPTKQKNKKVRRIVILAACIVVLVLIAIFFPIIHASTWRLLSGKKYMTITDYPPVGFIASDWQSWEIRERGIMFHVSDWESTSAYKNIKTVGLGKIELNEINQLYNNLIKTGNYYCDKTSRSSLFTPIADAVVVPEGLGGCTDNGGVYVDAGNCHSSDTCFYVSEYGPNPEMKAFVNGVNKIFNKKSFTLIGEHGLLSD